MNRGALVADESVRKRLGLFLNDDAALIDKYIEKLNNILDKEISDLNEIISIICDEDSLTDSSSLDLDVTIMVNKRNTFVDVKRMVAKASLKIDTVDNEVIMTTGEKKIFYKLVKVIMFFRRIFRIK